MNNDTFFYKLFRGNYDKTTHIGISCILTVVGAMLMPWFWAAGAVLAIGVAKEFADSRRPSDHFDIPDLGADALGIGIGLALSWFTRRLFF